MKNNHRKSRMIAPSDRVDTHYIFEKKECERVLGRTHLKHLYDIQAMLAEARGKDNEQK